MRLPFPFLLLALAASLFSCGDPDTLLSYQSETWIVGGEYDDSSAPVRVSVAAVCLDIDPDPAVNRAKMTGFVDTIVSAHPDVRLIVFGETSLGYYYRPSSPMPYQRSVAESVPGPTTGALAAEASSHGVYISFGLTEDAGVLHNSQVLLDPAGAVVSVHRKMHMTSWDIQNGFQPGSGVTFNEVDGVRLATIICYDGMSASAIEQLAAGRPGMVILSLADMEDESFVNNERTALFCNAWMIAANRFGDEDGNHYDGHHWIGTPTGGYRVKETGHEGYVYANIGVWP